METRVLFWFFLVRSCPLAFCKISFASVYCWKWKRFVLIIFFNVLFQFSIFHYLVYINWFVVLKWYTADYLCILLRKYNVTNHSNNCNTKAIMMQCLTERHHYQHILLLLQEVSYCNVNTCMHSNINFSVHIIFISWIMHAWMSVSVNII